MKPVIYITATPIGSVNDISAHAIEVLTNADLIVCEDTRITQKLLHILGVKNNRLESLHAHNEKEKSQSLVQKIIEKKWNHIALVTDAGTPAISDPGSIFVALAHENGLEVRNVPGSSSLVCALAASGFSQPRHVFSGFLSRNLKKQKEEFTLWTQVSPCIGVFFESPKRILGALKHLSNFFHPATRISLSREISKKFEENVVMTLEAAFDFLKSKKEILGEFVACVEILPASHKLEAYKKQDKKRHLTLREDCKIIASKYHLNAKDLYAFVVKHGTRDSSQR